MAHLLFDAHLREVLKVDGDIARGPITKNKKTAEELGVSLLSLSVNDSRIGRSKSPCRSMPKLSIRTGQRKGNSTTPHKHAATDRFIPNRGTTDLERSHHLLVTSLECSSADSSKVEDDDNSLRQRKYKEAMGEMLNGGIPQDDRILSFKSKCREPKESHVNNLKVLYSSGNAPISKSACTRLIPSEPEKILDAPELLNDYYLHLMDWSTNNHLAVALGSSLFIWNGGDGSITSLAKFDEPDHVCSVSWMKEGSVLAVGLSNACTQLWDVGQQKMLRTMEGHSERVCALTWNSHILSSGSKSGQIKHHDVRQADHITSTMSDHTQGVCGLKWSIDGRMLASGGNDNLIFVYDRMGSSPLHSFRDHQAAVKGLAWCPWQNNLLVSGGGTMDRTIRLWNCTNGVCLKTINTNSQVSSLLWSEHYRELISGHGYAHNQLTLWKYPSFTKIQDLTGHTDRVLELCLSPDGQTVVSAASDETLRLWKCWAVDKKDKLAQSKIKSHSILSLARTIR